MASFNQIILLGNLTRDPELRYLPNNTPLAAFGMAVNRRYKAATGEEREEVLFIDVTALGKYGEVINQYCRKGDMLFVTGRLRLEQWDDKRDGSKKSKHSVICESFQLMPRREGAVAPSAPRPAPPAAPAYPGRPAAPAPPDPRSEEPQFDPGSIPF